MNPCQLTTQERFNCILTHRNPRVQMGMFTPHLAVESRSVKSKTVLKNRVECIKMTRGKPAIKTSARQLSVKNVPGKRRNYGN